MQKMTTTRNQRSLKAYKRFSLRPVEKGKKRTDFTNDSPEKE